ncbi:MAG: hypothetical protein JSV18_02965 [Candidatus Bathyarchaeota archaeon]|nr:MAG: hypothetical protein JSV18_02965 [Candidatus Bathyarchaeota archaeon]
MSRASAIIIGLTAIAIGMGVPGISLYASLFYGFNYIAAAFIAVMAVLVGGVIIIIAVIEGPLGTVFDDSGKYERQRLRALRENQKATLEEFDDIVSILGEIRDLLRSVEE